MVLVTLAKTKYQEYDTTEYPYPDSEVESTILPKCMEKNMSKQGYLSCKDKTCLIKKNCGFYKRPPEPLITKVKKNERKNK